MENNSKIKSIFYLGGSFILIAFLAYIVCLMIFGDSSGNNKVSTAKIENLVPNNSLSNSIQIEQASTAIGKSVKEVKNTVNTVQEVQKSSTTNTTTNETSKNNAKNETSSKQNKNTTEKDNNNENKAETTNVKSEEKAPVFTKPVQGEIIREYAKDKLVYSDTLKEWITHLGIDIKAEKTSVVKCAADGRVSAIKNDPRYGLTVIVEHSAGYKTVYSNLLTAEFVTEGEEIKSEQTIGTIGNTGTFEVLDDAHLHFEILKDNENVDPSIYMQ